MTIARKVRRLAANLIWRRQAEESLTAELRAYVDDLTERNLLSGMNREQARRGALIETGSVEQIKQEVREAWLGHAIESALQDVRFACRSLARSPGFGAIVVGTLALGIGATLAMFALMRGVLWRPLPYPEPNRIVDIQVDARNVVNTGATAGEVLDLQQRSRTLEQISTVEDVDADLQIQNDSEHVRAARVSDNFLPLLGARPVLGRTLDSRKDEINGDPVAAVISNQLWRRRLSADPHLLGTTVWVNNAAIRVVGILAPGFRLFLPPGVSAAENIDIWFPESVSPERKYRGMPVLARLRPGATIAEANAELNSLAAQFQREYPAFYSGGTGWQASPSDRSLSGKLRLHAIPLHAELTRDAKPALFLLSGAVAFVLLIACVNAANLMLARGSARQQEFEIRRALGARTVRIMRQLLTESLLLALGAAAIGLLCARIALHGLGRLHYSHVPLQWRIGIDPSVAGCALLLAVLTTAFFGLLPAWRMASAKPGNELRTGRSQTAGSRRLQRSLVIAEVALSIVPLVCGGLMLRSFVNLLHASLGFDPANVVTAKVPCNLDQYPLVDQRLTLLHSIMDRVRGIPGVLDVSAANPLPLADDQQTRRVGRPDWPDMTPMLATQQGAAPGYLRVIGTPLLAGRDFTDADVQKQATVTIIDDLLAKRLWPEGAIGKWLVVYRTGWRHELQVIGVTPAIRATRVRDSDIPHFIMPDEYPGTLVIKTTKTPEQLAPRIEAAVHAAHPGRSSFDIQSMSHLVAESMGDTRFILLVLSVFAAASIVLAAVGLYGTLAYLTARRTREFGIRLALGSGLKGVVAIVLSESVRLAAAGIAFGIAGVGAAAGAMRGLLYGVAPLDAVTLACVTVLIGFVALAAAGVPAWRAARIDPQTSLRSE